MSLCLTSPIVSHSFDTLLNTFFFSFSSSCRLSPLISLLLSISSYLYLLFYSTFPPLCLSPFYFPLYLYLSLSFSQSLSLYLSPSLSLSLLYFPLNLSLCVSFYCPRPILYFPSLSFLVSSHIRSFLPSISSSLLLSYQLIIFISPP